MRKKSQHRPLGRLDLILTGIFGYPVHIKQDSAFNAGKNQYGSYIDKLSDEDIKNVIRSASRNYDFDAKTNVKNELVVICYFTHIEEFHEEELFFALNASEKDKHLFWDIWGVLDDGSILNPSQTEPYLSSFPGNIYNEIQVPHFDRETQVITYKR